MPLNRYFNKPGNKKPGKGAAVLKLMEDKYGPEKGKEIFYATVNKHKKEGTPAQKAAQPKGRPKKKSG